MRPSTHRTLPFLGLLSSLGTLLCCALPALLVALGLGSAVASALGALPWLVTLSRNKDWLFAGSGLLLAGAAYYTYRVAPRLLEHSGSCPPDDPEACARATRASRIMLRAGIGVYAAGASAAYLLPAVLERLTR